MRKTFYVLAVVCVTSLNCAEPLAPRGQASPVTKVPTEPARPVWTGCPTGPVRIFDETTQLSQWGQTQFILCGNGTLDLHAISSASGFDYPGWYTQADSNVVLSLSAYGESTARIRGDTMTVTYSAWMQLYGYVSGAYVLEARAP